MTDTPSSSRVLDTGWRIDEEGLRVPAADPMPDVLDVHMEGRRIWTLSLDDHELAEGHHYEVRWPPALLRRLDGVADVEVRAHDDPTVLAQAEVSFGTDSRRVELVDEHGRDLVVHKWGKLNQSFDSVAVDVRENYLDQVDEVLRILVEECGVPAFISFGTLLGAVRSGRLIGHDVDVDLGYFSEAATPADAMRESFAIERTLSGRGWRVARANGGFLQLFLDQLDGSSRNIDVFTTFSTGERLYQVNDVATDADRTAVLPLSTVELEGRSMPAPHRPEVFLEAAYGPGWRVPDPSFRYSSNPQRRKVRAWFGGLREERDRWGTFYTRHADEVPTTPTPFAPWAQERLTGTLVFDMGCGNGRDSKFFYDNGMRAIGLDVTGRVIRSNQRAAAGKPRLSYAPLNLASLRQTLVAGARATRRVRERSVYARFLLHGLSPVSRDHFWRFCSMVLRPGERCLVEFRTDQDAELPKHFTDGWRGFLNPDDVVAEASTHGAREVERLVGVGLASFHDEDPHVCRLVLEWT